MLPRGAKHPGGIAVPPIRVGAGGHRPRRTSQLAPIRSSKHARGTMRSMVEGACSKEAHLIARAPSTALGRGPPSPLRGAGKLNGACGRLGKQLEMLVAFGVRCRYRRRGYGVVCVDENRAGRCFGVSIQSAGTCWIFIARRPVWRSSLMVQVTISAIGRSAIFAAMRGLKSAELQYCAFLRKN